MTLTLAAQCLARQKAILIATVLLGACAPSMEEVQAEFNAEVASARACQTETDCTLISPGCPLDCWVAISSSARTRLEQKARELIEDYESGGAQCDYECIEAPTVACLDGLCTAVE